MRRAVKISLKFITEKKRKKIQALLQSYRAAVNFFIQSLWTTRGGLNSETLARLRNTRLSERYKSQALKQALDCVINTKKVAMALNKKCSIPVFKGGARLDAKFITIEEGEGSFDTLIKLSTLQKGKRIWLPCKRTVVLNKWFSLEGARLIQGGELSETHIILWVDIPDTPIKTEGAIIGCDIGKNKMLAFSNEELLGREFSNICDKIARRVNGSNGKQRAIRERENYINFALNQIGWNKIQTIVVEDLKNLKLGKKSNRSRSFRRKLSPWTYAQVLCRMRQKCGENRVFLVAVDPAFTSQICPICGYRDKGNRHNEAFFCLQCSHVADADVTAAKNILARYLGSVESPNQKANGFLSNC